MRRALAAAAVAALALTGCSGSDEPSAGSQETPTTSAEATAGESTSPSGEHDDSGHVVEIEIEGDRIEPRGERVEVTAGEPLTLKVESDRAAGLHVHSSPEQEFEVEPGESTFTVTVKTPGIVDVEEHESGVVVLQLEVR